MDTNERLARLDTLAALRENWDGEGSAAPSGLVVDRVLVLIWMLNKMDLSTHRIFPLIDDGGIFIEFSIPRDADIEFHNNGGIFIEFSIPRDADIEFHNNGDIVATVDGDVWDVEMGNLASELRKLANELL